MIAEEDFVDEPLGDTSEGTQVTSESGAASTTTTSTKTTITAAADKQESSEETKGETTAADNSDDTPPAAPTTTTTTTTTTPTPPAASSEEPDYGTYLNDPLSNPNINRSVFEKLQWTKGHAGLGLVTKTFQLDKPLSSTDEKLTAKLQHNCTTGKVVLFIGGEQVWEGMTSMYSANVVANMNMVNRTFYFGKGTKGMFFFQNECNGILPSPSAFRYAFWIENLSPVDEATRASDNNSGKDFKVWVPRADVTGDGVAWYRVDTKRLGTGTEVAVHRRFRDFHNLHAALGSYFRGSHLFQSLPSPPAKGIKMLQNHHDPTFIEERRVKCEAYLRQLMLYPRIATIQEMHTFLGLSGGRLREMSVLFQPGSLGLKMSRQGMGPSRVGVAAFNKVKGPPEDGGGDVAGPAEASGLISVGDSLTRVAGEDVTEISYDEVIQRIMAAPRPLVLHFTGYEVAIADDEEIVDEEGGEVKREEMNEGEK